MSNNMFFKLKLDKIQTPRNEKTPSSLRSETLSQQLDESDSLEINLLDQSLEPGTREYQSFQTEKKIIHYLNILGVQMGTDPERKENKYWERVKRRSRKNTQELDINSTQTSLKTFSESSTSNNLISRRIAKFKVMNCLPTKTTFECSKLTGKENVDLVYKTGMIESMSPLEEKVQQI